MGNLAFDTTDSGRDFYGYIFRACGVTDKRLRDALKRADMDGEPTYKRQWIIEGRLWLGDLYGARMAAGSGTAPKIILETENNRYEVT